MAIEIMDFPSYKMVIFHSFLYIYQRVPQVGGKFRTRWEQQVDGTLWLQQWSSKNMQKTISMERQTRKATGNGIPFEDDIPFQKCVSLPKG